MMARSARKAATFSFGATLVLIAGCASPLDRETTETLRRSVADSARRELEGPSRTPGVWELQRAGGGLDIPPDRVSELEQMAGPASYASVSADLGPNLLGEQSSVVSIALQDAIARAVRNNLEVESARLAPAISEAQLAAAEAAFDWTFFANFRALNQREPTPVPVINNVLVGSALNKRQQVGYDTGVRQRMTTGGELSISQGLDVTNNASPGVSYFPDPAHQANLTIALDQPLLRGFGSDATMAEIRLARNLERDSILRLRERLIDVVTRTEASYWSLYLARRTLLIRERLLERGVETRDVLKGRLEFDVKPAEYSDAVARVEQRRADVIRAKNAVRQRADELKALINDPAMPVGDELTLAPLDGPVDAPIRFSLFDALSAALARRPEVLRAILAIDDASIRQDLADNLRLPQLDMSLQARFNGIAGETDDAYDDIGEAEFINYLAGLAFEQPIGNRAGEALSRQRRLERMQAVIDYRAVIQRATLALKASMRDVETNYRLIEQTRVARLAAAENLRTLLVEEQNIRALTPDFLDLKLRRQESLAQAELEEARAIVDYNVSLARFSESMGDTLERNRIELVVPAPGEALGAPWTQPEAGAPR